MTNNVNVTTSHHGERHLREAFDEP